MGLLSHRIRRKSLKPGDHIYTYRVLGIYAHHGIYVGDGTVIHFNRHGQKPSFSCSLQKEGIGIVSTSLNSFLSGGKLYRFEYGVSRFLFLVKIRGGTCTMARSDPDDVAIHRAKYLLAKGFGCYHLFGNNCENFAVYCKTGLARKDGTMGKSGQVESFISGLIAAVSFVATMPMTTMAAVVATVPTSTMAAVVAIIASVPLEMIVLLLPMIFNLLILSLPLNIVLLVVGVTVATAIGLYCNYGCKTDIGMRSDVEKVSVEDLKMAA